jgi:hypothetical protein
MPLSADLFVASASDSHQRRRKFRDSLLDRIRVFSAADGLLAWNNSRTALLIKRHDGKFNRDVLLLGESMPPLFAFALRQGHQYEIPELDRTVIALQLNWPRLTFERIDGNPRQAVDHSLFVKLLSI